MLYITSDTHFFHNNLEKWGVRKSGDNKKVLEHWKFLSYDDTLIHLGDVIMGKEEGKSKNETLSYILRNTPGSKILVRGNHDKESIQKYLNLGFNGVFDSLEMNYNGRNIQLTHEPIELGSFLDINLHGHHHGKYGFINKEIDGTFRVDVSVENTNLKPIPLDNLIKLCI